MPTKEERQAGSISIARLLSRLSEKTPRFLEDPAFRRWFMLIMLGLFTAFLSSPNLLQKDARYGLGDIAEKDIKASRDLSVEDYAPTERKRAEAAQAVPPVYDLDPSIYERISKKTASALDFMREKGFPPGQSKKTFENLLGISNLPDEAFSSIERNLFPVSMEEAVLYLVRTPMQKGILPRKSGMISNYAAIAIRGAYSDHEEHLASISSIFGLNDAQKYVESQANHLKGNFTSRERRSIAILAQKLLQPNLIFNIREAEKRREQARLTVKPVYLELKKGEIIVREGERIQQAHLIKLEAEQRTSTAGSTISIFLGSALLAVIILKALYNASLRRVRSFVNSNKNLLFLCTLMAFILLAAKISLFVIKAVTANLSYLYPDLLLYALPVASGAMLVSVFFTSDVAIIFSLPASILAALLLTDTLQFFIYFLVGSIVASRNVSQLKERGNILKGSMVVGLSQMLLVIALGLSTGPFFTLKTLASMFMAFLGGTLVGVIVIGLIPIVEIIFGYTTNFKLLELASMDHPLLQELMVQAPGTYHHSVIVGNMVESAARAISANSLLAKVSAYYHDIGKTRKPAYFIENQIGIDNKHVRLAPSMSSLILISHVKDGVELARRHRLCPELIDVIRQHHGTSLISYFYEKAKNMQDQNQSPVRIEDFRYPGPIPQTKEAALVMLADAVEAASRTINDPTPARVKGMVQKIINNIFADGQLNDCELTLKDMHQIAKSFTLILTGIFHQRIEYPDSAAKTNGAKKTHADPDLQQAKSDKDRPPKDKEKGGETLRRLGSS